MMKDILEALVGLFMILVYIFISIAPCLFAYLIAKVIWGG